MVKVKIGIVYDERESEGKRYFADSHTGDHEESLQRTWHGRVTNVGGYRIFDLQSEEILSGDMLLALANARDIASLLNSGQMERRELEEHPFGDS